MPHEQRVPGPLRPAARDFFPWAPEAGALRIGPVYLLALSYRTELSRDGDERDPRGYYLHRALVAVAPSSRGTIVVTGRRLGRRGPRTTIGFSQTGASRCTVSGLDVSCPPRPLRFARSLRIAPHRGWRGVKTELRIGRTGCFRLVASGRGLRATIPLAVPGPDWGTPGW
jgi:hypothetical protein